MRIAKYIANAGVCSRREAEKLIEKRKVFINGKCCEHPSAKVTISLVPPSQSAKPEVSATSVT